MPEPKIETAVREAVLDDLPGVQMLLLELGYEPGRQDLLDQLKIYLESESARVFVAHAGSELVGLLAAFCVPLLHEGGSIGRVTSLVVNEQARRGGIGRELIAKAEGWFKFVNCKRVEVTSGSARTEAHAFYKSCGFEETGKRFVKRYAGERRRVGKGTRASRGGA